MLTTDQFTRVRRLADHLAGIALLARHRGTLDRRLHRSGVDAVGVEALVAGAEAGEAAACQRLISLLTTNHTGFFRHPRQIQVAVEHARRALERRGIARLWSAAASTGEEPWSLALGLCAAGLCSADVDAGAGSLAVEILASDIDRQALAVAEAATYSAAAVAAIPEDCRGWLVADGPRWRIASSVREMVRFTPLNLIDLEWPVAGPLDVVCCRNVLMYLGADHRYGILERIAALLAPDGLLLLDPSEHLGSAAHFYTGGAEGVYGLRPRSAGHRPSR